MIDVLSEELIPLTKIPDLIPSTTPGRRLAFATIWRWTTYGVRGRRLETVRIGGSSYTSREAIARFAEHPGECDTLQAPARALRSPAQRKRDQARAAAILDRAGIK
jgi:hypothetical protein